MPVAELKYSRLKRLVGGGIGKRLIRSTLPFLGLDIESESADSVNVEYSPNRPDYSTEYGVALGLQGIIGVVTGLYRLNVADAGYKLRAATRVSKARPFITSIAASGGKVDDALIHQIISMQEDLHSGLGRQRRRSSIGVHDLDSMSFPLRYTTVPRNHRFVPLGATTEQSVDRILADSDVGRKYNHILEGLQRVPVILDAKGRTISLPPVINSALTTVTSKTRKLLIEVTGNDRDIEDVLAVLAVTLQGAGFELHRVAVSGAGNSTPQLQNREIAVELDLINSTIGVSMSANEAVNALARSRLDARVEGKTIYCTVPPYRFDILGSMDLVEEAALGYGVWRIVPTITPPRVIGQTDSGLEMLSRAASTMIGLGYLEALSPSLTSERILYGTSGRDPSNAIRVVGSKSSEHTVLRDAVLPGLVESLSRNVHEPYPQRLFEIGAVFLRPFATETSSALPVKELVRMACVDASREASFSGMKSVLQALFRSLGTKCQTLPIAHPMLETGRAAEVIADGRSVGHIGEVSAAIVRNLKIRVPVVAFEVDIDADRTTALSHKHEGTSTHR